MAVPVIMPRQGQSVESCIITKWHKKVGDTVAVGDILFSYETDKAAFDEEAKEAGTLLAILREEGDDVPCLENVCVLGAPGEDISAFSNAAATEQAVSAEPSSQVEVSANVPADKSFVATERAEGKISPRARALAQKSGADLSQVQASGPYGRVIARDVQALIDNGKIITPAAREISRDGLNGTGLGGRVTVRDAVSPAEKAFSSTATVAAAAPAAEYTDEPLPHIRKVIARSMHESLSTMAQLTHTLSYDASAIMELRRQFKTSGASFGMEGITIGDLIVFAVSRTLVQPEHKALNAHFLYDKMRYFTHANIGIAVDTPRGLMVPTLHCADQKSLLEISIETKRLAKACQGGSIDPDLLTGASFTVSNLGSYEIEHFTPVVNPPQTGILGVCTIQQRPREKDGHLELYPAMSLSLTYDHRALDGAPASRFLRDLKRNLENIQMLLGGGMYHV